MIQLHGGGAKMFIKPYDYQIEITNKAIPILKENCIVYLNMEERTGKSLIGIMCCEDINVNRVLIITKKKSMGLIHGCEDEGWEDLLNKYTHLCSYKVINYHSLHKVTGEYDIIILDEAHAYISGYPKTSKMWGQIKALANGKPIIYMSATSHAQGTQLLFHQLHLSSWSPWKKYKDFYSWYSDYAIRDRYGKFKTVYINSTTQAIDYTAINHDKVWNDVKHLFISRTRRELGFEQEPEDKVHYIELDEKTKNIYNYILRTRVLSFTHTETNKDFVLSCDTPIKLRWALHQIEGGTIKITNKDQVDFLVLVNDEKVRYIKETWGDNKDLVIMYHYQAEKIKLEREFKHARILQATSYAEGIDLSKYKNLVIYSQDFSTSKHTQRRARQANKNRQEEIIVHFLLVKKAVSAQVYKTVTLNKTNFVDSTFEREEL